MLKNSNFGSIKSVARVGVVQQTPEDGGEPAHADVIAVAGD
jgi:hypothetical protein